MNAIVISPSDIIFATVISYTGAALLELRLSGLSSINEVIAEAVRRLSRGTYFSRLRVRNYSTGQAAEQMIGRRGPVLSRLGAAAFRG